ncbi:aspartic peptidase domain-containing protein [Stachybotrys elegans]|uniref:Aspartic peptidase domain-containing protein n=1 Tax=Stachybotrys elegans TaxID=80388 RepID=A0A8K0WNS5_9HYPO|nr:aspartic peptidase domain-containing protein [Stachybotrys elegans]
MYSPRWALLLAGLLLLLLLPSSLSWDLNEPLNGVHFQRVKAHTLPTPDRPSPRFSRLRNLRAHGPHSQKHHGRHHHHHHGRGGGGHTTAVSHLARRLGRFDGTKWQNVTGVGDYSTQYAIQCAWDGLGVWLLFDTGSADTWASQSGFRCEDPAGAPHTQEACGFGAPLVQGFAHGQIDDVHFYLQYGSGEQVSGPMGFSDIACGGLSVFEQQVGLANSTYWHGNNVTVGILGLAYPSITSAYYGAVGDEAPWNAVTYPSFFTTAITQGSIDPVFSVSIVRNSSEGILVWGGLPETGWQNRPNASTDLIIANLIDQSETAWKYSFYTIIVDALKWDQTTVTAKHPYIVDTGTTMMYVPPPLAESVADAFQPRAVYLYQWGAYFAPCDAIPPRLAVVISGVEFWINPSDLIYRNLVDPLTGYCAVAVASGGSGPYILGDVFLQNVVAVFDVGAAQMRFYAK